MALKFLLEASLNSSKLKETYKIRIWRNKIASCLFVLNNCLDLNCGLENVCAHETKIRNIRLIAYFKKGVDFE